MKRTPLRRKSPLKHVSKKQSNELRIYYKKRKAFLANRPYCEACFLLGYSQRMRSQDVHHSAGRGPNLNNESTWFALCRICHEWTHQNSKEARKLGLLK